MLFPTSLSVLVALIACCRSAGYFVKELERVDGHKFTCQEHSYFSEFSSSKLDYWRKTSPDWSPEFIDNLTTLYALPFYYNRVQIVDGKLSVERSDYWCEDYNPQRQFPEHYYGMPLNDSLDYIKYLLNTYDPIKYFPNVDFLILGSEYYYDFPTYFTKDYPIFRHENSNPDLSIFHWLLPSRQYVQRYNLWSWGDLRDHLVTKTGDDEYQFQYKPLRERIDKAVFRGSVYRTESVRFQLLRTLSEKGHDVFNSYFDLKMRCWEDMQQEELVLKHPEFVMKQEDRMDDFQQMNYMFVIELDGSVSPDRLARQMLYGNVVFLQESQFKPAFYYDMKPYVHYIPWTDTENLVYRVQYYLDAVRSDNETVREDVLTFLTGVGLNGMRFILETFNSEYLDCFSINMLHLYAKTFEKTQLESTSLDEKNEFNRKEENVRRWHDIEMNKSVAIETDLDNYSQGMVLWPVEKVQKSVIGQINRLLDKNYGLGEFKKHSMDGETNGSDASVRNEKEMEWFDASEGFRFGTDLGSDDEWQKFGIEGRTGELGLNEVKFIEIVSVDDDWKESMNDDLQRRARSIVANGVCVVLTLTMVALFFCGKAANIRPFAYEITNV